MAQMPKDCYCESHWEGERQDRFYLRHQLEDHGDSTAPREENASLAGPRAEPWQLSCWLAAP
jgi:hypothetical protein